MSPQSKPFRKKLRLDNFDYRSPGAYFVTICTQNRRHILGKVVAEEIHLSWQGQIAIDCWQELPAHFPHLELDEFVIMSNHIHGILWIVETRMPQQNSSAGPKAGSLEVILRSFKSAVTKRVNEFNQTSGAGFWQRSFYDHILRDEGDLDQHRKYILENPIRWAQDEYFLKQ